jgi:NTE family protein
VRNLPYDVVKAMGADVVIGVDVSTPVGALGQDPSFLGVVSRTLDLATKVNVGVSRQQFTTDDVLMTPDLRDVTTASFPKMGDAARYGEEIARVNLERLRAFSVSNEEYAAWRAHQRAGRRGMQPTVGQVRVATDGRVDVRRVRPRVETRPDAPLDLDVLQDDLTRVYRIGEFESVDFRLDRTAGGSTADLVITTREKSWGPNYLRFGLSLVDHFDGNASYNLLFYHRRANLNALGAEWRNQLVLGDHFVLDSEFYQPVAYSGQWFVAPRFLLELDKFKTFTASGTGVNADRDRWQGRLDLGRTFSVWGELRLGAYSGRVKGGTEDSIEAADFDAQEGGWSAALAFDRLDNIDFPRRGWSAVARGKLSRDALGADDAYDRAWTELRAATSTGRMTFVGRFEGGTSFESTLPVYDRFELGGFTRLSGLEPRQLQGDEYFLAALGGYVRVASIGAPLGGNIYAGLLAETGRTWLSEVALSADRLRAGGSAFLGAETLLGPVYLGYGWTDGGDDSLYFYLGRVF